MLVTRSKAAIRAAPSRSRQSVVTVKAWAGDSNPFAGLLRIFTPSKYINTKEDWENTGTAYNGKISRGRKPFKDGFIVPLPKREDTGKQQQQEDGGAMSYLNQAAQRVVSNNFTGDDTEPDWSQQGHRGFTGDRRKRGHAANDFHNIKM